MSFDCGSGSDGGAARYDFDRVAEFDALRCDHSNYAAVY